MTALALPRAGGPASGAAAFVRPVVAAAALAVVVAGRWAGWRSGAVDPVALGGLFGGALLGVALIGGWRPAGPAGRHTAIRAITLGLAAGVGLAASALVGAHPAGWATAAAGFPLAPWAVATLLVAAAEEAVLRGALFDGLAAPLGLPAAALLTSVAFSLMHVPVYGWHAIPLDLGVGFALAGLRLLSGGVLAPAIAHAVADLAVVGL